jgi:hypothetical protein
MKYATEIFSCGMIYIKSFTKIGMGVQGFASAILEAIMLVLMMEGCMKYGNERGTGAIIYLQSFLTICSGIQMLLGGIHTDSRVNS